MDKNIVGVVNADGGSYPLKQVSGNGYVAVIAGSEVKGACATGGYGKLNIVTKSASVTLTADQTCDIEIEIPVGAMIIGVQLRNDTAIEGADDATGETPIETYAAAYSAGSTQAIATEIDISLNVTQNTLYDANADSAVMAAQANITLDAGTGNSFVAGGIVSAVAYYYELTSILDKEV